MSEIGKLIQQTMLKKWHKGSEAYISSNCVFCEGTMGFIQQECGKCLCPRELCSLGKLFQYLPEFRNWRKKFTKMELVNKKVKDISSEFLLKILAIFRVHLGGLDDPLCPKCGGLIGSFVDGPIVIRKCELCGWIHE